MATMWGTPSFFKSLTNFILRKFEKLAQFVAQPLLVMQGPHGNHIALLNNQPSWPWNNICLVSSCS
jgi:hypothetical protein